MIDSAEVGDLRDEERRRNARKLSDELLRFLAGNRRLVKALEKVCALTSERPRRKSRRKTRVRNG